MKTKLTLVGFNTYDAELRTAGFTLLGDLFLGLRLGK